MGIMRLVIVALAALCCVATAAPKQPQTIDLWLHAGVDIDGSGRVLDLQWDEQSKLHALVAGRLTPVVRSWEYEPATVDGRPERTRTGLVVHALVEPLADGSLALRVADARTGPTALTMVPPPVYPQDAARYGITALVKVTVEVGADGSPLIREMTYEGSESKRSHSYRKAFLASATEAVKHWKFRPEIVADQTVAGAPITIPIDYCLGSGSCGGKLHVTDAQRKLPAGLHMGDSSAVALKTDIHAQAI